MKKQYNIILQYHQIEWRELNSSFILHHNTLCLISNIMCSIDNHKSLSCNYKILNPNDIQVFFNKREVFEKMCIQLTCNDTYDCDKLYKHTTNIQKYKDVYNNIIIKTNDNVFITNLCNRKDGEIQVLTPSNLNYPITLFKFV